MLLTLLELASLAKEAVQDHSEPYALDQQQLQVVYPVVVPFLVLDLVLAVLLLTYL
jgi:hypothetical protein